MVDNVLVRIVQATAMRLTSVWKVVECEEQAQHSGINVQKFFLQIMIGFKRECSSL